MKTVVFKFTVSTRYVGSQVKDEISLEFDNAVPDSEIERVVEEVWIDWRNEQCDGGWVQVDEILSEDEKK